MAVDRDVAVGMDRVLAPLHALPAPVRQRLHVRGVDAPGPDGTAPARAVGLGLPVEFAHPVRDRPVRRGRAMQDMVARRRGNPAFGVKHSVLHGCPVARLPGSCREARDAVMPGRAGVGPVRDRPVA